MLNTVRSSYATAMPSTRTLRAKRKQYRKDNADKVSSHNRVYYKRKASELKLKAKSRYQTNPETKQATSRANSKAQYSLDPDKKKSASRAYSKEQYKANPSAKKASSRAYHSKNKDSICRDRYALAEPKPDQVELYMKDIQDKMCSDAKTKRQLIKTFRELNDGLTRRVTGKAVSRVAAKNC